MALWGSPQLQVGLGLGLELVGMVVGPGGLVVGLGGLVVGLGGQEGMQPWPREKKVAMKSRKASFILLSSCVVLSATLFQVLITE